MSEFGGFRDHRPAVQRILFADTSQVTDGGGLEYRFTEFTWFHHDPIDDYEVVLQRGGSNRYVVTRDAAGRVLRVRAAFVNPDFEYTGTREASTGPVGGTTQNGVVRMWLSPDGGSPPTDGGYGCDDDLRIRVQITGGLDRGERARAIAKLQLQIGGRERIAGGVGLPVYDPNDPSPISESDTSFEFGYHIDQSGPGQLGPGRQNVPPGQSV